MKFTRQGNSPPQPHGRNIMKLVIIEKLRTFGAGQG
jgi:hypothetical protein